APSEREIVRFSRKPPNATELRAAWEFDASGKDTGYDLEAEAGTEGQYYFPFRNVSGAAAEMGFMSSACDCSAGEVCILPSAQWDAIDAELAKTPWVQPAFAAAPQWQVLDRAATTPAHVPADGHGLLRISWNGRKAAGSNLKIHLAFWVRAAGESTS